MTADGRAAGSVEWSRDRWIARDLTLALDQLDKRGLLHRRPHPTDRRTVLAMLTPAGRELLDEASRALAGTGFGLASRLIDVLREVRGKIGDISPG